MKKPLQPLNTFALVGLQRILLVRLISSTCYGDR